MLVLSRKKSEQVLVLGPCVVQVVEIRGDKVRLGFHAQGGTTILREEVALADPRWRAEMERWQAWINEEQKRLNAELAAEAEKARTA